jgi:superoxide dismutase, Fe-Mn family
MIYKTQQFNIPSLSGLSEKQLEVHLGLYKGYVTHANLCRELIADLTKDEKNAYAVSELRRRYSFEFDGMRMHEYYFEGFEGGAKEIDGSGLLAKAVTEKYGDWSGFIDHFKKVGMSRGIGWTVLYFDPKGKTSHVTWIGDHEIGTLAGLSIILAMDMWEHAFMVDYVPNEKGKYIDAYLANTNFEVAEKRFGNAK